MPTSDNPGDLLTRGLSLTKFNENFDFWIHGPVWIRTPVVVWPSNNFSCLSSASRQIIMNTILSEVRQPLSPIVPFNRYSSLTKLIAVVGRVIECSVKLGAYKEENMRGSWGSTDPKFIAKLHLISVMQSQCFDKELAYLRSPDSAGVPDRIRDMNLFLDSKGILRSSGRMGKIDCLLSDVINPIVLGKSHDLTKLIIED